MFEAVELDRRVSKKEFETQVVTLRTELLDAQRLARRAGVPVIVVIAGADGAGKGDTVRRLLEWLDPRGVDAHAFGPLTEEERDRPPYWRFWRSLPPRGRLGIFFGSWYTDPLIRRVHKKLDRSEFDEELRRMRHFEELLVRDGALLLKFWFHLTKKAQRKRLERMERNRATRWRVTALDWKHHEMYERFVKVCEPAVRRTDSGLAPWFVVEAADDRYRDLAVGRTLLASLQRRLAGESPVPEAAPPPPPELPGPAGGSVSVLDRLDLSQRLEKDDYGRRLDRVQGHISRLARKAGRKGRSWIVVFEGWDAAGKGGIIRRLVAVLDARHYRVIQIAAPTDEERAQHYLWRFWRHIPASGSATLYDRSWYGRVLVERVEGFARDDEWRRAYGEINDFEQQLVDHGIILTKLWVHIDPDEQLRRFEERQRIPYKRHKITDEDWRNREKRDAYTAAVNEMLTRTSTSAAPWSLIAGNDKRHARVEALETVADRLERALR